MGHGLCRKPGIDRLIAQMESEVWRQDWSWLSTWRTASRPPPTTSTSWWQRLKEESWLAGMPGTELNALWGGSALAAWRRRGIYRALVARRAQVAVERGVKYLLVDASDDGSPILQRLGMHQVATATPWVWTPRD